MTFKKVQIVPHPEYPENFCLRALTDRIRPNLHLHELATDYKVHFGNTAGPSGDVTSKTIQYLLEELAR